MKTSKTSVALFVAVLGCATLIGDQSARADIPGARRRTETRSTQAPVKIQYQKPEEGDVRIIIPRHMVDQVLERVGSAPPASPTTPSSPLTSAPWLGTVVAGIALALAIASIPFVLRRRPAIRLAATAVIMLTLGSIVGWSVAYGDISPGPRPKRPPARPSPTKTITIEIGGEGETVQLWVAPQAR